MIYHYTTIENLALILNSKKIRFNRLDNVDDIQESSEYKELNFSKYLFVSCWTENSEENIALWNMYTPKMKGVRIGLPNPPFKMKLVNKKSNSLFKIIGEKHLPLTPQECSTKDYFVVPFFGDDKMFYKKIEYLDTDELKSRFKKLVTKERNGEIQTVTANAQDFAKLKHKRWSFQEESRFVLLITHPMKNPYDTTEYVNKLFKEEALPFFYFDLELDNSNIKKMEIILGPNCSEAEKLIVLSLAEKYGVETEIKNSILKGKIKF